MKSIGYLFSGALVVLALTCSTPDAWAQARGHGSSGGGGSRPSSGGGGGGTAVARGSGGGGGGGGHVSGSSGGTRTAGPSSTASGSGGAVQRGGSRPNYGRPVVGQAAPRTGGTYLRPGRGYYYYPYDPYYLYGYGAFGLGAFYYDPFWWGSPYGYGYPWGYYGGGYYGGGYYDDGYRQEAEDGVKGGIKLKVEPKNAEVYVDGYYVGVVDDYNGVFQRLNLLAGPHKIEFRAPGYQSLNVDVKIEPRETITYHGELQPARH